MPQDSYYPEPSAGYGDNATTATPENTAPPEDKEGKEEMGETGLLPLAFFGDTPPEPGHVCQVKVVHVYDDEVEVEYVDSEKDEKPARRGRYKEDMSGAMDRLDAMAE